jgi:hypothetical protein
MKKNYFFVGIIALGLGALSMKDSAKIEIAKFNAKAHKNANGAPTGKTGAPGEQTCTQCHSGTAQSGATENQFVVLDGFNPVTNYVPGQTYNVTLAMASTPAKKGFQAIALDGTNAMAGSFTGQTAGGTTISTAGTKQYANHNSSSNTNANMVWIWSWTAPATNVGNVTFYVATNKANDNGTSTGDVVYISQHVLGSTASVADNESIDQRFTAGYSAETNTVIMDFNSLTSGDMTLNLVDINGRSVFFTELGKAKIGSNKESVKLPSDLKNGIYFVNFFVNNNPMSAKILIQR